MSAAVVNEKIGKHEELHGPCGEPGIPLKSKEGRRGWIESGSRISSETKL